ncbi:Uncharacterised protein [Amycolatopsis camponoti]|uniref:Uncharacterized protein n=1 Tax=Amycolatopsis camponoti TaxID=2606593 RepID=A0A6I8LZP3_9PSEU|nr:Uncharacterised protein [Amycolatopsis camponoti]
MRLGVAVEPCGADSDPHQPVDEPLERPPQEQRDGAVAVLGRQGLLDDATQSRSDRSYPGT